MKRYSIYIAIAAFIMAATAGSALAATDNIVTWGADVTKASVTYYTYVSPYNPVTTSVNLAKPKGVQTPNMVIATEDSAGPPPTETTTVYMSLNGRLILRAKGYLLPSGTSAAGNPDVQGVLLLDDTLSYSIATGTYYGTGSAIEFSGGVDMSASYSSKKGVDGVSGRFSIHPGYASIVPVENGVPDYNYAKPTKMVMKPFSYRGTKLATTSSSIDYTAYAGGWDYTFTPTSSSVSGDPAVGVPQKDSFTLSVDAAGNASFSKGDLCGTGTNTVYTGYMSGLTMDLLSGNEPSDNCGASGDIVLTFSDTSNATGNAFIIDTATGNWLDGTLTITRLGP